MPIEKEDRGIYLCVMISDEKICSAILLFSQERRGRVALPIERLATRILYNLKVCAWK